MRFNAVKAGPLKTSSSAGIPGYLDNYLYAEQATLRHAALRTEEVANAALFLLSPRSSGINAQGQVVDAGMGANFFGREIVAARQRAARGRVRPVSVSVYVVLGRLEAEELELPARERVALASERAREALSASARLSGAALGELEKDERDAPLPSNGWHWSIAHAGPCVAGVVCRQPVGEPYGTTRLTSTMSSVESSLPKSTAVHRGILCVLCGYTLKVLFC